MYNVSGSNSWTLNVYLKNSNSTALAAGSSWNTMKTGAVLFFSQNITSSSSVILPSVGWVNLTNNTGNYFNYAGGAIEVYIEWTPTTGVTLVSPFTSGNFSWKYDTTPSTQAMGTSASAVIPDSYSSWSYSSRRYQTQLTYTASACTGASPGNTVSSSTPTCPGPYTTILSLQNSNLGTGATYQWFKNGVPVSGATNPIFYETISAADTYYCAVTCSGSSQNSNAIAVAAPLAPVTAFSENFDSYTASSLTHPDCWFKVGTGGSAYINASYSSSTSNSFLLYSGSTTNLGVERMTNVSNLGAGTHRFRFKMRTNTTGTGTTIHLGYLVDPTDVNTFVSLGSVVNLSGSVTGFQEYIIIPPVGTYTSYIALKHAGDVGSSIFIDDVSWEPIPSCSEPTAPLVTNASSNSLTVSWTPASVSPSAGYEIYYSTSTTAPTSTTTPQVTGISGSSTSGIIPNLLPGTVYNVWVRSNCGAAGTSVWTAITTGKTMCTSLTSFTENFDSYTAGTTVHPTCWAKVGTGGTSYVYNNTSNPSSAPNCLYFSSLSPTAQAVEQLMPVSNLGAGTHRLRFKMRGSSTVTGTVVELGYLTNPLDPSTFISLGSVTNISTSTTGPQEYYIVPPAGTYSNYIAIRNTGANTAVLLIDDIFWEALPTCVEPTNITTNTITSSSANITWAPPITVPTNGYQIYVSTSSTPPVSNSSPTHTGVVGTSFTIPNLMPSSAYFVWMRSVCSSSESSAWSQVPFVFFTPCQPLAILSTTGATICSNNTANLSATAESGATINWYDASSNGNLVANGATYTTPVLTGTTNYWVSASVSTIGSLGKPSPDSTTGNTGLSDVGLMFDVFKEMVINSVDVYPYSATSNTGTITIAVKNAAGITLNSTTASVTVNTTGLLNTVPLNFTIPPGIGYRLVVTSGTGLSYLLRESGSNFVFPYTLSGFGSITSSYSVGANNSNYFYFYNWKVSSNCESARTQVTATVSCLGTAEASAKDNLVVYPNPFTDVITISDVANVKNVLVTDIAGRLVRTVPNPNSTLHFGDLKQGAYLFVLEMKDGSRKTIKAIKK